MAQSVTLWGASYSDVPAIDVPKTGGGTATFTDTTPTTASASDVSQGKYFFTASGVLTLGTATGGSAVVSQDQDGYLVLDDEAGEVPTIASLNVTQNGTYTAPTGVAYSPVTVNVEAEPNLLARNVEISTSEQTVTAQSKILTGVFNKTVGAKSGGYSQSINSKSNPFAVGTSVRISGTITIIGDNDTVLEEIAISEDNYIVSGSSSTITISNSSYLRNIKFYLYDLSTSKYLYSDIMVYNGTFGWNSSFDFYGATDYDGLSSVTVGGGYDSTLIKNFISRSPLFTDFTFPSGITSIGNYAFTYCTDLALTSLPSSITSIGDYGFRSCANLALTSLPSDLTYINVSTFAYCNKLTLTSLPSGLKKIYNSGFEGCDKLALTSLPNGLNTISQYAFRYCHNVTFTSIPSGVTSISGGTFQECEKIPSISSEGVITTLGSSAFNGNSSHPMQLTSASFPNMALTSNIGTVFGSTTAANACQLLEFCDIGSTTGIAANAFANCYALETLVLRKTSAVCTLANVSAFLNTPMRGYDSKTGTVYVPEDLISSYQTATNWSTLYNDGTVEFKKIEGSAYEL